MFAQTVALANCCRIFCSESAAGSGVPGLATSDAWGRAFLGVWYAIWLVRAAAEQTRNWDAIWRHLGLLQHVAREDLVPHLRSLIWASWNARSPWMAWRPF